jgi:hypothetical protein
MFPNDVSSVLEKKCDLSQAGLPVFPGWLGPWRVWTLKCQMCDFNSSKYRTVLFITRTIGYSDAVAFTGNNVLFDFLTALRASRITYSALGTPINPGCLNS